MSLLFILTKKNVYSLFCEKNCLMLCRFILKTEYDSWCSQYYMCVYVCLCIFSLCNQVFGTVENEMSPYKLQNLLSGDYSQHYLKQPLFSSSLDCTKSCYIYFIVYLELYTGIVFAIVSILFGWFCIPFSLVGFLGIFKWLFFFPSQRRTS